MWKFGESLLGREEDRDDNLLIDESDELCSLSPLQRIYAFAVSMAVGLIFMLLSLVVIAKPIKFAVLFTMGNILAVGSTAFLLGPAQQGRMMFDSVRVYASAIYIGSVILALICAILIHNKLLTLLVIIIEICALMWYSLSYIPFARRVISNLFIRLFDTEI
ncbi:hypothetical protein AQUCO_01300098v1 [Aquilegia coerulea]|uniref:Vesicle transport protein n=1 Tax=Aquilegia coerulea TaxID=218851 RepID=A0A2G5DZR3_AQUCA|nr:hypothetical protein AQUCO_01300098v1 [Aquilegia coerulea]